MPIRTEIEVIQKTHTFTTIRNTNYFSSDDFPEDDMEKLKNAERFGEEVEVMCEAADGYYDIVFDDGYKIDAISWYLLDGYTADGIE